MFFFLSFFNKKYQLHLIFFNFREPFPVGKQIQPAKILGLISRGLAVNCSTLSINLIIDNIIVGALLPELHVSLFKLLESLILV